MDAREAREQRGLQIAATKKVKHDGGDIWHVPSQSGEDPYRVDMRGPFCTCSDHTLRRVKCKHIYAVEYTIREETKPDGTKIVTKRIQVTYKQDWPAYNLAQTHEKEHFVELLRALCQGVVQPPQKRGRPRLALADMVFATVYKVYTRFSARRFTSDLNAATAGGFIDRTPHFNSVNGYLNNPALTAILKSLIEESATPLKSVETNFAADSTGFGSSRFVRWYDHKYGKIREEHTWLKAHLMIGVKTNVVTSVEVTGPNSHDSPFLPDLITATKKRFTPKEISADKGYISNKNLQAVVDAGAVPYIPFKVNATGEGPELWRRLWHYYEYKREEFLDHYHKRSNVESTNSMIKAKFGDALVSREETAQINEVLCKVLAHNLCCLIQSMYELGIEATFWGARATVPA